MCRDPYHVGNDTGGIDSLGTRSSVRAGAALTFDARWAGPFGIARYAQELRSRLPGPIIDVGADHRLDPAHVAGIVGWQSRTLLARAAHPSGVLLSPSFTPSRTWGPRQAITIHDLIHLDVPEECSTAKRAYYEHFVGPAVRRHPLTFTVSQFSKQRLVEWSGVDESRVVVTGNAAGPQFTPEGRPTPPATRTSSTYVTPSRTRTRWRSSRRSHGWSTPTCVSC